MRVVHLVKCPICGKPFNRGYVKNRKYCGKKCFGIGHIKDVSGTKNGLWKPESHQMVFCPICGTTFESGGKSRGKRKQFCSPKCKKLSQSDKVTRNCCQCGKSVTRKKSLMRSTRIFCSKSCSTTHRNIRLESWTVLWGWKGRETSIERMFAAELSSRGITFQSQFTIRDARTRPDFFIPPSTVVYCDGDYWHRLPVNVRRDCEINRILPKLGYKVHRFWECDIRESVALCVDKIMEGMNGSQDPAKNVGTETVA